MKERVQRHSRVSIRWKLVVFMAVFILLVLAVTWLFQVFLLGTFHEETKRRELLRTAEELERGLSGDAISSLAYNFAVSRTMSVAIYRMDGEDFVSLVNVDAAGQGALHIPSEQLKKYCRKAAEREGVYLGRMTLGGYEVDPGEPSASDEVPEGEGLHVPQKVRMVCTKLVPGGEESGYLIFLSTNLQPLDATVVTLQNQFLTIAVILLAVAGVMVFFLYRTISAPLEQMNRAAKQLAKGKYDVEFSMRGGYLETRELADTLNYAAHELSRVDRLQKELIANISHDLRTPLTMIRGYGEVMRDLPGESTPENMQVMIDETTRLSELVDDMLELSRLQAGTRSAERQIFSLTEALRSTLARYDAFVRHQGYRITLQAPEEAYVYADRGMLLQVLYNLINNAVTYTGEDRSVEVRQEVNAGRVRISVLDTGKGIPPEQMPVIWERYYQVDEVHRRAKIGTGLGLSIVKELLELHGAAYGIDSTIGEGSCFWFELPAVQDHTEE